MAILLVTYDLKAPGRNYQPVWTYLQSFTHCKGLESVWVLDTILDVAQVRDALNGLIDTNDRTFVCRIANRDWASMRYSCGDWLNDPARNW